MGAPRYIRAVARNALPIAALLALCTFGVAMAQSVQTFSKAKKPQLSSTRKFVINKLNVAAGDRGQGTTVVVNRSKKMVTVRMTQVRDRTANPTLAANLMLSVYDSTTKRCYWPKAVKGKCAKLGAWNAAKLNRTKVVPKIGKKWKKKEKHSFLIQWQLRPGAPNTAQGKRAQFQLVWKAS